MNIFLHFYFYTNDGGKKIYLHTFTDERSEVLSCCSVNFDGWNLKWTDVVRIFSLLRFFLIILNHTSQFHKFSSVKIFQSNSSHLLLFTPRHAKSQPGRGRALIRRLSFSLQAPADSADSIFWNQFKTKEIIWESEKKYFKTSTVLSQNR